MTEHAPLHILLVDDDEDDYGLTRDLLAESKASHFVLTWAATFEQAIQAIQEQPFDAGLIDYRLGAYSGLDLIREVYSAGFKIPMILLTGFGDDVVDIEAMRAGAADYLTKEDLSAAILERAIRHAIEREQILDDLRTSEERYRTVVEGQTELVWRYRRDGTLTFMNEAFYRFWHLSRDTSSSAPFQVPIIPEDQALVAERLGELCAERPVILIVHRVQMADGEVRWLQRTERAILDGTGQIVEYQAVARDISDQKRAELAERDQRNLAEALAEVSGTLTSTLNLDEVLDRILEFVSRVMPDHEATRVMLIEGSMARTVRLRTTVAGYEPIGYALLVPVYEIPNMRRMIDQQQTVLVMDTAVDSNWIRFSHESWLRSFVGAPIRVKGEVIGFLNLDSSEPNRFNASHAARLQAFADQVGAAIYNARLYQLAQSRVDELQQLYDKVRQLEQLKSDMIRIAAHDLRGPLGHVIGYVDLLRADTWEILSPTSREFLSEIQRATQRMKQITTDILSLERIEDAEGTTNRPFDLLETVQSSIQEQAALAGQKGLDLRVALDEPPVTVHGDRAQIHEAASNLISNAIKYTPNGGTVEVALTRNGARVEFRVRDSGIGIPLDQQANLFRPFYRVKSAEMSRIEGTGLGLHLVKNIVERHGGEVFFQSAPGSGSTFGFRLPLVAETQE